MNDEQMIDEVIKNVFEDMPEMKISVMQGPCDHATFEDRFKRISITAVALCKQYNDHHPEMMAFTSNGEMMSIGTQFKTEHDSACFADFCRGFFRDHNVHEYYFISSAWNLTQPSEEEKANYRRGAVRENPRSKEILFVIGKTYFESKVVSYDIKRNKKGKITSLNYSGEGKLDENSNYGNLLPEIKEV